MTLLELLAEAEVRARILAGAGRTWLNRLRLSGHDCPGREPVGRIEMGDIAFDIDRAYFRQGHLVLTGTAPAHATGRVEGHLRVIGLDEEVAFRGNKFIKVGVKPAGSTWQFTEAIYIQGTQVPPGEFDHSLETSSGWDARWTDRLGRWLER